MAILESDIKLLASQVLDDVPEGGGAATGNEIVDGVSNNLFPDISMLDRTYGAVSLRKVFFGADDPSSDSLMGAHLFISRPPKDPRVSAVLFDTNDPFDVRESAQSRVESYLALGPLFSALLFGNHIAGMRSISMLAETVIEPPPNGSSLVLVQHSSVGPTAKQQFVRITKVETSIKTFVDDQGPFQKKQIDLEISDPLREDYAGFEAQRKNTGLDYTNKGRLHDTVVADATIYHSISALKAAANPNDFVVRSQSIHSQLVPSAQTETAIIDARMNQRQVSLLPTGSTITRTGPVRITSTSNLYIGGGVTPGSFSMTDLPGGPYSDADGILRNGNGDAVGTIDYVNGVVTGSSAVNIDYSNIAYSYRPTASPTVVTGSLGRDVTEANRGLTWVVTLDPAPARGSVEVHYRSAGQWYVLRDGGSGGLRGSDTAFGAGVVNFDTGSVAVTLGALPDVGSKILFFFNAGGSQAMTVEPLALGSGPKLAFSTAAMKSLQPGSFTAVIVGAPASGTGTAPASPVATISGGNFTGTINHPGGNIDVTLTALPAVGAQIRFDAMGVSSERTVIGPVAGGFTDGGATWNGTLDGGGVTAGSIAGSVDVTYQAVEYPGGTVTKSATVRFRSNAAGQILTSDASILPIDTVIGAANAGAGTITLNKSVGSVTVRQPKFRQYYGVAGDFGSSVPGNVLVGYEDVSVPVSIANPSATAMTSYTVVDAAAPFSATFTLSSMTIKTNVARGKAVAAGTTFSIGTSRYMVNGENVVLRNVNPLTGVGTTAGSVSGSDIIVTSWNTGDNPAVVDFRGIQSTPVAASERDDYVDMAVFRTAISPIRPESFNVSGTFQDGTTFSVFADEDGIIDSASAPAGSNPGTPGVMGVVDVTTGVVTLRFGSKTDAGVTPATNDLPVGVASTWGVAWSSVMLASQGLRSKGVRADTLRYNASAYSYIPLDADILGLDTVRLPSDGRVLSMRKGSVAIVHHTAETLPQTVGNGTTIDCGRTRLSRVRVIGADGARILAGYTHDLDAGTVTFDDVTGYSQPVRVQHRVEDSALVTDAQINGTITLGRPLTHVFPADESYVSSAMLIGNLRSRVSTLFDQVSWTGVWSDTRIGTDTVATYDQINSPIECSNDGTITERWALIFTNTTSFQIVGEHLGVVGTGTTGSVTEPLNPNNNQPYFSLKAAGFGAGWATGNVIRFNTAASKAPGWVARTIQQGPATEDDDSFEITGRADVDA